MSSKIEIIAGPAAGRQFDIATGAPSIFGRSLRAQFAIPEDPHLSGVHFSLELAGTSCTLRDLASTNGTFVKDGNVTMAMIAPGETFSAGNSTFLLRAAPDDWEGYSPEKKTFLSALYSPGEPVFAVLDASKDDRIPAFLAAFAVKNMSLYEGSEAEELRDIAPYLAAIPKGSKLIEILFREGWGRDWGIFLTSKKSLPDVCQHLRKFLTLHQEDGRARYFRFYDPRVIRAFIPSRTAEQELSFYGPILRFVMQGEDPAAVVQFRRPDPGVKTYLKLPDEF